jgi:hypothetical protein
MGVFVMKSFYRSVCRKALWAVPVVAGLALGWPQKGSATTACTVSSMLVNSCGPVLEVWANKYPEVGTDEKSQIEYFEKRAGRQATIVRTYNPPGYNTLSADDIYFATRANTILEKTWRPSMTWADAGGSDASVNATIDQMAASVKSVAPHKIILAIHHEPEPDVSGGAPGCPSTFAYKGTSGTPTQYRAMWANVEKRFAADGVTNVVWAMNYMGAQGYDCMVDAMWPGNSLVDWVLWDPYANADGGQADWYKSVSRFYNVLTSKNDTSQAYLSKNWGFGESGVYETTEAATEAQFAEMKAALDNNTMPRLKDFAIFDSWGGTFDSRVGCYDTSHDCNPLNQAQQNSFNTFAKDAKLH